MLSLPKKTYKINMTTWSHIIMLSEAPNWEAIVKSKWVSTLDWITFNFSYCISIEEISLEDDIPDTAMARAKNQIWVIKSIATERVRKYEAKNWKMPLKIIIEWTNSFIQKWQNGNYKDFLNLYISLWWDLSKIGK